MKKVPKSSDCPCLLYTKLNFVKNSRFGYTKDYGSSPSLSVRGVYYATAKNCAAAMELLQPKIMLPPYLFKNEVFEKRCNLF